ncbi:MAG: NUDIX hydrolase [Candidatus Paceibacterota bacterium]|jgi:ADP-ribose pyrophosphatase YjhB (NUDIX family)
MHRELQVGVKILLKNKSGRYLLIRRNPKKYPEIGPKWDIVGGRIKPGTGLVPNLKREVKEETGLILKCKPTLVAAQDILRIPERHVVRLTYQGTIVGTPKIDSESLEYKWFTKEEIFKLSQKEIDIYFKELIRLKLIDW